MNEPTPYVLAEKIARETGYPVRVVNLDHPEADRRKPKGDTQKFATICIRHKTLVTYPKRRDAHHAASHPCSWCPKCEPKA